MINFDQQSFVDELQKLAFPAALVRPLKKAGDFALQASGVKPYVALARQAGPSAQYRWGEITKAIGQRRFPGQEIKNFVGDKMIQTSVSNAGNRLMGAKFDFVNGGQTFSNLTNFN